jgi:hypothetical protein
VLGDFGIALDRGTCIWEPSYGTEGFRAPEVEMASQRRPARAHPAMDVWSCGVVLLELAIGCITSRIHVPSVLEAADMQCEPAYMQLLKMCLRYGRRMHCLALSARCGAKHRTYTEIMHMSLGCLQVCSESPCHSGGAACVCEGTAKDPEQEAAAGALG